MYISYDDEPAPTRSATAEIWRDCVKWAAIWTAFFVALAAVGLVLQAFGFLLPRLTVS
jgi:hypothetical protein